jgi:hypothetical protein
MTKSLKYILKQLRFKQIRASKKTYGNFRRVRDTGTSNQAVTSLTNQALLPFVRLSTKC